MSAPDYPRVAYREDVVVVLSVVAGAVLLVLAVWAGHRSLAHPGPASSGGNALGGFEVFDPARARGREDLDSKEHEGEALPDSDDDAPVRVDLRGGTVRVRRPSPGVQPGPAPGSEPGDATG